VHGALTRLDLDTAEALPATSDLLVSGGDARLYLDGTGRNRYGCAPTPQDAVAAFGSSTASTISAAGYAAAERRRDAVIAQLGSASSNAVYAGEIESLRRELASLLGLDDLAGLQTVLAGSGTDLHRLTARLVGAGSTRPLLSIVGEPAETGSGVPSALTAGDGTVSHVCARAPDGGLRDPGEVDAEVEALAEAAVAEGRRVLLIVADLSKTGLIIPSLDCALALRRRHRHQIDILIDACQFRLSPKTLRTYLQRGLLVAMTGSKFLAGPSFAGALFVPAEAAERLQELALPAEAAAGCSRGEWPAHWRAGAAMAGRANFGLLLRWSAAIEHLRAFSTLPEYEVAAFLARFRDVVAEAMWKSPALQLVPAAPIDRSALGVEAGWDCMPTIFPFALRSRVGGRERLLSPPETSLVHRLLRTNLTAGWPGADGFGAASDLRIELGQPVMFGRPGGDAAAALRLCVSAPLVAEALSGGAALHGVLDRARGVLAKAAWIAEQAASSRELLSA